MRKIDNGSFKMENSRAITGSKNKPTLKDRANKKPSSNHTEHLSTVVMTFAQTAGFITCQ